MTDYQQLRQQIASETKAKAKAKRAAKRQRRRPLPSPPLGAEPYGAKQCTACRRWFPAMTYRRNDRWHCPDCGSSSLVNECS